MVRWGPNRAPLGDEWDRDSRRVEELKREIRGLERPVEGRATGEAVQELRAKADELQEIAKRQEQRADELRTGVRQPREWAGSRPHRLDGDGPYMPRFLHNNVVAHWVLGFLWVFVRDAGFLWSGLMALGVAFLGIASETPVGIALGVVVGIPGTVIPAYAVCTRWRRDWAKLATMALAPASFAAFAVLASVLHW